MYDSLMLRVSRKEAGVALVRLTWPDQGPHLRVRKQRNISARGETTVSHPSSTMKESFGTRISRRNSHCESLRESHRESHYHPPQGQHDDQGTGRARVVIVPVVGKLISYRLVILCFFSRPYTTDQKNMSGNGNPEWPGSDSRLCPESNSPASSLNETSPTTRLSSSFLCAALLSRWLRTHLPNLVPFAPVTSLPASLRCPALF